MNVRGRTSAFPIKLRMGSLAFALGHVKSSRPCWDRWTSSSFHEFCEASLLTKIQSDFAPAHSSQIAPGHEALYKSGKFPQWKIKTSKMKKPAYHIVYKIEIEFKVYLFKGLSIYPHPTDPHHAIMPIIIF